MPPIERNPNRSHNLEHSTAFEDRLLNVEDGYSDVKVKLAEHSVKLDYMGQSMEKGMSDIRQSIDKGMSEISSTMAFMNNKHDDLSNKLEFHESFISDYQEKRKNRRAFWMKVLAPILSTVLGAVGMYIFKELTGHHGQFR